MRTTETTDPCPFAPMSQHTERFVRAAITRRWRNKGELWDAHRCNGHWHLVDMTNNGNEGVRKLTLPSDDGAGS